MKEFIRENLRLNTLIVEYDAEHLGQIAIMVPVNKLVLDKENLTTAIKNVKANRKSQTNDVIYICRTDENSNKYYLLNGYHRFVDAIRRGKTKMRAMLFSKSYEELKKLDVVAVDCAWGVGDKFCNNFKTIGSIDMIKKEFNLNEGIIDDQKMNPQLQTLCNTMSVRSYHEVLGRIISAIGHQDENQELWAKIKKPLDMLEKASKDLNKEKKENGMTGDSEVDEANTWWSAIQSTLCEQGPEFQ